VLHVYLPIAEVSTDPLLLAGIGWAVGMLSGLFGVGGGFLVTPLLIFLGIPPAVAAATGANTVIAPSVSGVLAHWRRGTIDLKMGAWLLAGGLVGSGFSILLFGLLQAIGQIDLAIALSYVVLLGTVGGLMLVESMGKLIRKRRGKAPRGRLHTHYLIHRLPLKVRFPKSRLYISVFVPILVGAGVGVLSGLMGVGGGFMLVPAMIYLIGMPTSVVVGTSLFQIICVAANVTFLQAAAHQTVDVVLAMLLIAGGIVGAPIGAALGRRLGGEQLRALLALIVLGTAVQLGIDLFTTPADRYSLMPVIGAEEEAPPRN